MTYFFSADPEALALRGETSTRHQAGTPHRLLYGRGIVARLAVTHPERLITAILGGHSGYRDWEVEDERFYEVSGSPF